MGTMALIPARGGSKGVPGKNIKILGGKPLIQHTIDAAREVFKDSKIIVSTDDIRIKEVVEANGLSVPFLRPNYLATDTAGTYEVLLHAVDYYEKEHEPLETLVLLQPTSPFRTAIHIKEALSIYDTKKDIDMVVSVSETKSNPYYVLFEESEKGFLVPSKSGEFIRRQDCPKVYEYNGAIYIIKVSSLRKSPLNKFKWIKKYEMDDFSSLDIDSPTDWNIAEQQIIYAKNRN